MGGSGTAASRPKRCDLSTHGDQCTYAAGPGAQTTSGHIDPMITRLIIDAAVGTARLSKITADLPDDPADRRAGRHAERRPGARSTA